MHIQSFINSSFKAGASTFIKKNPYTGETLHTVENADMLAVVQSIQGAQKAFVEWSKATKDDRVQKLKKIVAVLQGNKAEFAKLEAWDQGLPFDFSINENIEAAIEAFNRAIKELSEDQKESSPTGLISIIGSWNLSLRTICERWAPALAAGNAVLIKVSSTSPVSAYILSKVITEAELPIGLTQVIVSNLQEVKDLLVTHPSIKAISFVGTLKNSSAVLQKIASVSLNQFKKVQISSGSKNTLACIADANEVDFNLIMKTFMIGQGQLTWNSNRLFILEKYEAQWVEKIQKYLAELKPATSPDDNSVWTPCLKDESFGHFGEIEKQAKDDQAKLIESNFTLNEKQKVCFLKPAFTKDMSNCSTLQQDQVMAPLFILSVVKYPFDIPKYSNVSYYGLAAHLFGDESKLHKVAEALEVGEVFLNKWSVSHHQPLTGVKQSGFGLQDYRVFGAFFSNVKNLT